MRLAKTLLIAALLAAATAPQAGPHHHDEDHKPQHGGVMVIGPAHMDWELVAKPDRITVHVRDEGKALSTSGASGKLTLLSGKDKAEALLKPAGGNRLEASGPFKLGSGTKVVATITLAGKAPANVRFVMP